MWRRSLAIPARPVVAAALTVLAWSALAVPAAEAVDTVTIPLAPGVVELSFTPQENVGTVPVAIPVVTGGPIHDVVARYGGSVTLTVPPQEVDTGHVGATLSLQRGDDPQSRVFSTDPNTPPANRLTLTALGGNRYRIQLPADDGVNGPVARLLMLGLELRPGLDVVRMDPVSYRLRLSSDGPPLVALRQQAIAVGCPPDQNYAGGCGPISPLSAGQRIRVTLPSASRLRQLGIQGLQHSAFAIQPHEGRWPSQSSGSALRASVSADGVTATVTVPAGIPAGQHQFPAVVGDPSGQLVTITGFRVYVVGTSGHQSAGSTTGAAASTGESSIAPSSQSAPVAGHDRGGGPSPVDTWLPVGGAVLAAAAGAAVAAGAAGAAAIVRYRRNQRKKLLLEHPSRSKTPGDP